MTELFVAVYLDEDVDVLVAELARVRGYDAITALDAGRTGHSDPDQLAFAVSERRAIVTHNRRDFALLAQVHAFAGHEHHGIILATRRSPYDLVQRLVNLLNQITADEMRNQLLYI
jgi:hypothetical protein